MICVGVGGNVRSSALGSPSDLHRLPQNPQQSSVILLQMNTGKVRSEIFHILFWSKIFQSNVMTKISLLILFLLSLQELSLGAMAENGIWLSYVSARHLSQNNILQSTASWIMRLPVIQISWTCLVCVVWWTNMNYMPRYMYILYKMVLERFEGLDVSRMFKEFQTDHTTDHLVLSSLQA